MMILTRLPDVCILENRAKVKGEAVMLITMYELAYPNKQQEVAKNMGLGPSAQPLISRIINYGCDHFLSNFLHLIMSDELGALDMWNSSVPRFRKPRQVNELFTNPYCIFSC